jgi:Tfp pilus assembly ATPase PilU
MLWSINPLGTQTMDESLADLTRWGVVTTEAVLRRAQSAEELSRMLGIQAKA